jgi:hypothetical protein
MAQFTEIEHYMRNKSRIIKWRFNCTPPSSKKMRARVSEMLVPIYQTTQPHFPE